MTVLFSVFWRRFTRTAALWTLVGGLAAIGFSLFVPEVIRPFAHGVPMIEVEDQFLAGIKQYKFMRACYGICVCVGIGVVVTLLTKPESRERQRGLVWGTVADALHRFKGAPGTDTPGRKAPALAEDTLPDREPAAENGLPFVCLSRPLAEAIEAGPGDLVYITDSRWWLGGLHSAHATVEKVVDSDDGQARVQMEPSTFATVVTPKRRERTGRGRAALLTRREPRSIQNPGPAATGQEETNESFAANEGRSIIVVATSKTSIVRKET